MTTLATGQPEGFLSQFNHAAYTAATSSYSIKGFESLIQYRDSLEAGSSTNEQMGYIGNLAVVEVGFLALPALAIAESILRFVLSLGVFAYSAIAQTDESRNFATRCFDQSIGSLGIAIMSVYCLYANTVERGSLQTRINQFLSA